MVGTARRSLVVLLGVLFLGQTGSRTCLATGVPIDGFLPLVGTSLTREFVDDITFAPVASDAIGGPQLDLNGVPHYDVALLDTGAAVSLLNTPSQEAFGLYNPYFPGQGGDDGFQGAYQITIGGATGFVDGDIADLLGLYAAGLQSRTAEGAALELDDDTLLGQTNTSLVVVPPESDLPNVLGLSFVSQYATRIRSDQPQVFELAGNTVRTPSIEFFDRGSGGHGISRKAPMSLNGETPVTPQHVFDILNLNLEEPWENPYGPTFVSGGLFLNVNVEDDLEGDGGSLTNFEFFFDTGASVTVVSELNALRLGHDVILDAPEFTLSVVGSAGTKLDVPGFFADKFTIQAIGGNIVAENVPIVVLDIVDPADPNNVIDGFVGTNLLAGRNLVIDPNPASAGGPSAGLYISDPVTVETNWSTATPTGAWTTGTNWSGASQPDMLSITNVRHVSGSNQTATLTGEGQAWEVNISGVSDGQEMVLHLTDGAKLTTFSGVNVEQFGALRLEGATVDTQYLQVTESGFLSGDGVIRTGSGPIPGQVENVAGSVAPGDANDFGVLQVEGRFSNGTLGTLAYLLSGVTPGVDFGQLDIDGDAAFAGTLEVSLFGDYTPDAGDSFVLATYDSSVGQFDTLLFPAGFEWDVEYGLNSLVLTVTPSLAGDYNGDGVVNAADYVVWRNEFGTTGSSPADGDGSGTVDEADYTMWRNNFGGGTGSGAGGRSGVPESATSLLLLVGTLLTASTRRRR